MLKHHDLARGVQRGVKAVSYTHLLGLLCEGTTVIRNAERLRLKESDRIAAMEAELIAMAAKANEEHVQMLSHALHGAGHIAQLAHARRQMCIRDRHGAIRGNIAVGHGVWGALDIHGAQVQKPSQIIHWALVLTAGFVVGERVDRARRKKKAMKDKIENELKKK